MPENSTPGAESQDDTKPESQDDAGTSTQDVAPEGDSGTSVTDVAQLQKELNKARKQAAETRAALKLLQDERKSETDQQLTEQQRLEQRVQELERTNEKLAATVRESVLTATVTQYAAKLGIIDPDAAVKLLDKDDLELDDDGRPLNVEQALKELVKEKPYLVGKMRNGGSTTDAASGAHEAPPPRLDRKSVV